MKEFSRAEDMLDHGETALFVFTAGDDLEIAGDGSGRSGYWKINPNRRVDRIVIYLRNKQRPDANELYRGSILGIDRKDDHRRRRASMTGSEEARSEAIEAVGYFHGIAVSLHSAIPPR